MNRTASNQASRKFCGRRWRQTLQSFLYRGNCLEQMPISAITMQPTVFLRTKVILHTLNAVLLYILTQQNTMFQHYTHQLIFSTNPKQLK